MPTRRRNPMSTHHWTVALRRLGACDAAIRWARQYKTASAAWRYCRRGDWMLWIAGHTCGDDRRQLVLAACACARLPLKYVPKGEKRPLKAIQTAEAWARGKLGVTIDDVRNASADAAYAADAAAAREKMLAKCADVVRKHLPCPKAS